MTFHQTYLTELLAVALQHIFLTDQLSCAEAFSVGESQSYIFKDLRQGVQSRVQQSHQFSWHWVMLFSYSVVPLRSIKDPRENVVGDEGEEGVN